VSSVLLAELQKLVSAHGYWVVALIVGLESMGLPLPGETILVLAAIYAATEPSFNVGVVIAVAAFGAIVGDNAGYWLGLRYGYALLLRYGKRIGMFEARIKLGNTCSSSTGPRSYSLAASSRYCACWRRSSPE
jgi:membrane protein DedA with SNARE-associated domain